MSLENLLRTGQLKPHAATPAEAKRLLAAAERNLGDARNPSISTEARYDCANKAILQSAQLALHASGYRPDAKRPGHHAITNQSLALTLGIQGSRIAVLDKHREKRNVSDYTGAELDGAATQACIAQAARLIEEVRQWLATRHPDLLRE